MVVQTASNSGGISTDGLPPVAPISLKTIPMAGLLVDVYGLDELPASVTRVSCLWLHHQRTRNKEHMREIAARCVGAWNESTSSEKDSSRGLIALAYDQRNHGTRLVHDPANGAWREGNKTHAQDMLGGIVGMVGDQRVLLDVVESYLFHDSGEEGKQRKVIDHHLALGVSLGGHSVWQLMFADPRVRAGVAVIGCPDYMNLITDRARLSKLSTYSAGTGAATFLGSKDFPPSLVAAACRTDPKGILFGTSPIPSSPSSPSSSPSSADEEESQRRQILIERLQGKQFLLCNGAEDKLVPPRCGEAFTKWFKEAAEKYKEPRISVDERTYAGVGHTFSVGMVKDAVEWVKEVVKGADADIAAQARNGKSKI
ncbi:hypothetical protein QBC45DRAFT_168004 [Copromyces sp. CBS 386.78]|nr:hypothetical protein QBC45DRAFT_168004 [Copromyces sp. CBS 386.78]